MVSVPGIRSFVSVSRSFDSFHYCSRHRIWRFEDSKVGHIDSHEFLLLGFSHSTEQGTLESDEFNCLQSHFIARLSVWPYSLLFSFGRRMIARNQEIISKMTILLWWMMKHTVIRLRSVQYRVWNYILINTFVIAERLSLHISTPSSCQSAQQSWTSPCARSTSERNTDVVDHSRSTHLFQFHLDSLRDQLFKSG